MFANLFCREMEPDMPTRRTVEGDGFRQVSFSESASKEGDANRGGEENANDRAHNVTERKGASVLRYASDQLWDIR